jgi:hypothetical protein
VDLDFLFRRTPRNVGKLKQLATRLHATVLRPYYPVSDLFRLVRDDDGLQVDFMGSIHGIRSFEGLRDRGRTVRIAGVELRVACLDDIIRSKGATWPCSTSWRRRVKKKPGRRAVLAALRKESERAEREMIRRWQALPMEKRTNFLRKRVGLRATAL